MNATSADASFARMLLVPQMARHTTPLRIHVAHVVGLTAEKKVRRIHAKPVVAAVQHADSVRAGTLGDLAKVQLPREAVAHVRPAIAREASVAGGCSLARQIGRAHV